MHQFIRRLLLILFGLTLPQNARGIDTLVHPGEDLQAVLDRGDNLLLQPSQTYSVTQTLRFKTANQSITTHNASTPETFATLRLAPGETSILIDGNQQAGIILERVILDGNRIDMQPLEGKMPDLPLISLGKPGGIRQEIRQCVVLNSRSAGGWAAIHIHEGARALRVEDNIVFGSGADARGNGRAPKERAFGWGDGISTASPETVIRNNVVIDATDEGIMIQGAPGTLVENNMVAAISREMLGGIALIDPSQYYVLDKKTRRHDYRKVIVRNNHIDARGARIHIALPMGGPCWHQNLKDTTLVGATIENNTLTGEAAAYGFVANGIDDFTIQGNVSRAAHSGMGVLVKGQ